MQEGIGSLERSIEAESLLIQLHSNGIDTLIEAAIDQGEEPFAITRGQVLCRQDRAAVDRSERSPAPLAPTPARCLRVPSALSSVAQASTAF